MVRVSSRAGVTPRFEESLEQQALIAWSDLAVIPEGPLAGQKVGRFLFSIPNGSYLAGDGKQRAMRAGILKREGMRPGVHDLFLMVPRYDWHGLFIEMKREKGGQASKGQRQFAETAEMAGYLPALAHGCEQAVECIIVYLNGKGLPDKCRFS